MEQEMRAARAAHDEAGKGSSQPSLEGPGSLLPQVQSWSGVARETYSHCEKAAAAAQKMRLRRNQSGQ